MSAIYAWERKTRLQNDFLMDCNVCEKTSKWQYVLSPSPSSFSSSPQTSWLMEKANGKECFKEY